jgi:hypothetical protein
MVYSTPDNLDMVIIVALWIACAVAGRIWGTIIGDKIASLFLGDK